MGISFGDILDPGGLLHTTSKQQETEKQRQDQINQTYGQIADILSNDKTLIGQSGSENKKTIDDLLGAPLSAYRTAGLQAGNQEYNALTGDVLARGNALQGYQNALGGANPVELGAYAGDVNSAWNGFKANPTDVLNESDALRRLRGLSNPQVTAQERFLEEQAWQRQQQDMQRARSAVAQDARARGVYGSGDELATNLAAAQQTGNQHMMADLGTSAGAVARAMQALQGYGNLASTMRGQSSAEGEARAGALDAAAEFNKQAQAQYNKDKFTAQQQERDKAVDRAKSLYDARTTTADDEADRWAKTAEAIYGHAGDIYGAHQQGAGLKVGANAALTSGLVGADRALAGNLAQRDATLAATQPQQNNMFGLPKLF